MTVTQNVVSDLYGVSLSTESAPVEPAPCEDGVDAPLELAKAARNKRLALALDVTLAENSVRKAERILLEAGTREELEKAQEVFGAANHKLSVAQELHRNFLNLMRF